MKKTLLALACTTALISSTLASAQDLVGRMARIINISDATVSFQINNQCSAPIGTITPNMSRPFDLDSACEYSPNSCEAVVYKSDKCTGDVFGTVKFDVEQGITGATMADGAGTGYQMVANDYNLTIKRRG
jgi:hypothetical protein